MKAGRFIFALSLIMAFTTLLAHQATFSGDAVNADYTKIKTPTRGRFAPEWQFVTLPVGFQTSYYDYMPGSYNGEPLCLQPVTSSGGYDAGGFYFVYHATETSSAERRVYSTYFDENDEFYSTNYLGQSDIREGYPGLAIDSDLADPFFVWHCDIDNDGMQEILISYDSFHLLGFPGVLVVPEVIIDDDIEACAEVFPRQDNEYNWPYVHIGPSPLEAPYKRLYVVANNYTEHESGYAAHNPIIAYADYNSNDQSINLANLNWRYNTVAQMDAWDVPDPEFYQGNHTFFVTEDSGTVGFVGYSNSTQEIYVYKNDNYGEGEFTEFIQNYRFPQDNIQNQNGEWVFAETSGEPYDNLYFSFTKCTNFNSVLVNDSKLFFPGNMALRRDNDDGSFQWFLNLTYAKVYGFDLQEGEFFFSDLSPKGAHPSDNTPMIPWDLDENGIVDEYDDEGNVTMELGWPFYYWDSEDAWDENNWKISQNDDEGWLAVVWQDALYSKLAHDGVSGYDSWMDKPEICIAISMDSGETWADPIRMHANNQTDDGNYVPELVGLNPCYIYPADKIEYLYTDNQGNKHGLLRLGFFDDHSHGSYVAGNGTNDGGELSFMSLDITFNYEGVDGTDESPAFANDLGQNYPNPFNPETTISYSLAKDGHVNLSIYNVRGQKVKTLLNSRQISGANTVTWNGKNEQGETVSGGVYFYKLQTENQALTRKMLLLK